MFTPDHLKPSVANYLLHYKNRVGHNGLLLSGVGVMYQLRPAIIIGPDAASTPKLNPHAILSENRIFKQNL